MATPSGSEKQTTENELTLLLNVHILSAHVKEIMERLAEIEKKLGMPEIDNNAVREKVDTKIISLIHSVIDNK